MKKLLLSLFLITICSPVFARFSGTWEGEATLNGQPCTSSEVILHYCRYSFSILKNTSQCGNMSMDHDPFSTEVKDGVLLSDGQEVGAVTGNSFKFSATKNGYTAKIEGTIDHVANTMNFTEIILAGETPVMHLQGAYKLVSDPVQGCPNLP